MRGLLQRRRGRQMNETVHLVYRDMRGRITRYEVLSAAGTLWRPRVCRRCRSVGGAHTFARERHPGLLNLCGELTLHESSRCDTRRRRPRALRRPAMTLRRHSATLDDMPNVVSYLRATMQDMAAMGCRFRRCYRRRHGTASGRIAAPSRKAPRARLSWRTSMKAGMSPCRPAATSGTPATVMARAFGTGAWAVIGDIAGR